MRHIDLSFWDANQMPVVISGLVGYTSETVPIKGGTRTYHWFKLGKIGIELTMARATPT